MNAASVRAMGSSFEGVDTGRVGHVRNVASAFSQLYENRRVADYDNATQWSRVEVLTEIELVEQAFASWQAIRGQDIANDYLLSLFVRERQ
jgi:hypothetical protein